MCVYLRYDFQPSATKGDHTTFFFFSRNRVLAFLYFSIFLLSFRDQHIPYVLPRAVCVLGSGIYIRFCVEPSGTRARRFFSENRASSSFSRSFAEHT